MSLGRREFLAGTAAVGAGLYLASRLRTAGASFPGTVAVHDGRTFAGRSFAAQAGRAGLSPIDLGVDPTAFWNGLRADPAFAAATQVIGVTGFDEFVHLHAFLAERRLRLRRDVRLDCCGLDLRTNPHWNLLELALAEAPTPKRLAVAGNGGTLFAWRIA